jgi:hypothetical protein
MSDDPTRRPWGLPGGPKGEASEPRPPSEQLATQDDLVLAATDLVGRAGARSFEIGWECPHGDDAPEDHNCPGVRWYAQAEYRNDTIREEGAPTPGAAAEWLARRLLTGARCRCGRLVAMSDQGATVFDDVRMADGSRWTAAEAAKAGQCRWVRRGPRWVPGCPGVPSLRPPSRW